MRKIVFSCNLLENIHIILYFPPLPYLIDTNTLRHLTQTAGHFFRGKFNFEIPITKKLTNFQMFCFHFHYQHTQMLSEWRTSIFSSNPLWKLVITKYTYLQWHWSKLVSNQNRKWLEMKNKSTERNPPNDNSFIFLNFTCTPCTTIFSAAWLDSQPLAKWLSVQD